MINFLIYLFTLVRAIVGIPYVILSTAFTASTISITTLLTGDHLRCNKLIKAWAKSCCSIFGVKIDLIGAEKIPTCGILYVFNHTSYFDIFAISGSLIGVRYGAKIELFKVPILGAGMRLSGVLPIARNKREEVLKVYQQAEKRLAAGERFALAPEGTRQHQEKLAPFKSGPFIFAINAKAPIVPLVIKGALDVMPRSSFLPNLGKLRRTITIEVLDPVPTSAYSIDDRPVLQGKVQELMGSHF